MSARSKLQHAREDIEAAMEAETDPFSRSLLFVAIKRIEDAEDFLGRYRGAVLGTEPDAQETIEANWSRVISDLLE